MVTRTRSLGHPMLFGRDTSGNNSSISCITKETMRKTIQSDVYHDVSFIESSGALLNAAHIVATLC